MYNVADSTLSWYADMLALARSVCCLVRMTEIHVSAHALLGMLHPFPLSCFTGK